MGQNEFELANGVLFEFQIYDGSVTWHEHTLDVHIMESECDPTAGYDAAVGQPDHHGRTTDGKITVEELQLPFALVG